MTAVVVDASVAVKWFVEEEYSAQARSLLSEDTSRLAPDFILVEFAHVALKQIRRHQLPPDDARAAGTHLTRLVALHPAPPLVRAAFEIGLTFERSIYDSLYVALAMREGCQLVTADRRLYNALASPFSDTMLWIEDV